MVKLLIFDADGTLFNTDDILIKTWTELFSLYKPKDFKFTNEYILTFSGPPLIESIKRAFPEYDSNFMLEEYINRTKKYYDTDLKLFDNEVDVLKKLKEKGFIITILTSKNRERTEVTLKNSNTKSLFDAVVTSSDNFKTKPHPDGIFYLMNKFNADSSNTIMIGDSLFDAEAAENAGIDCILMTMCPRTFAKEPKVKLFVNNYKELYENLIHL